MNDSIDEVPTIVVEVGFGREDESTGCDMEFVVSGTSGVCNTVFGDSARVVVAGGRSVFRDTVVNDADWEETGEADESVFCGTAEEDGAIDRSESDEKGEDAKVD